MTQNDIIVPTITIGIVKDDNPLKAVLKEARISLSFHNFPTKEAAFKAILEGEIAACACSLAEMPIVLPLGLVITALSERKTVNNCLVSKNTEGGLFTEKKDLKVMTLSGINCAQMQYLQPQYQVEKADLTPFESIGKVNESAYDAVILSQNDVNLLDLQANNWKIQPFSVREFIPKPGQGVTCFIVAEEDLPTRRLLKEAHYPSVSAVTNIERTVQKMLKDYDVSAYCERDRMGNYHLWAAALIDNDFRKIRLSQSTTFGMAEKAVEQLLSA